VLAVVFGAMLLSAVATESIGIHALFGAFLFGAVIPHDGRLAKQIRSRAEDLVVVLLLPIFFAFTGMRTQVGLLSSASDWLFCALIIVVATLGKFGGSFAAAKLSGLGWRESSAIGILMNTRGLMELVVLDVGLDMGVLSPTLFAMLVIMALVTTFSTTPLLNLIVREQGLGNAPSTVAAHRTLRARTGHAG
jgi:Kef-type K+ transport system membrane component KefB